MRTIQTSVFFSLVAVVVFLATPATAEWAYLATAHNGIHLVDTSTFPPLKQADEILQTDTVTFNIMYEDVNAGFKDPTEGQLRRERLHDALEYVAEALGRSGTLDVRIETSLNNGQSLLAFGGTFFATQPGFQRVTSLRRLEDGVKPFQNTPEILIQVDFAHNWHFGGGEPGPNQFDFLSTLIHEVTHGMGFLSTLDQNGNSSTSTPKVYTTFDRFLGDRNSGALFFDDDANILVGNNDLNSDQMGYVNNQSTATYNNGGERIPLFSPATFLPGSSFMHVDTFTVVGNPVMTHIIGAGVTKRFYSTADLGVLRAIGFPNAVSDPGTLSFLGQGGGNGGGGEGEGESEGEDGNEEDPPRRKFLFCAASPGSPTSPAAYAGDALLLGFFVLLLLAGMLGSRRQMVK